MFRYEGTYHYNYDVLHVHSISYGLLFPILSHYPRSALLRSLLSVYERSMYQLQKQPPRKLEMSKHFTIFYLKLKVIDETIIIDILES